MYFPQLPKEIVFHINTFAGFKRAIVPFAASPYCQLHDAQYIRFDQKMEGDWVKRDGKWVYIAHLSPIERDIQDKKNARESIFAGSVRTNSF